MKTRYPLIGKMMSKFNPVVRMYLQEYEWLEDNECQITDNFIKAGRLFIAIMKYCWLQEIMSIDKENHNGN